MIIILDRKRFRWETGETFAQALSSVLLHRGYDVGVTAKIEHARAWVEEHAIEAIVILDEEWVIRFGSIKTIYPIKGHLITSVLRALGQPIWTDVSVTGATVAA